MSREASSSSGSYNKTPKPPRQLRPYTRVTPSEEDTSLEALQAKCKWAVRVLRESNCDPDGVRFIEDSLWNLRDAVSREKARCVIRTVEHYSTPGVITTNKSNALLFLTTMAHSDSLEVAREQNKLMMNSRVQESMTTYSHHSDDEIEQVLLEALANVDLNREPGLLRAVLLPFVHDRGYLYTIGLRSCVLDKHGKFRGELRGYFFRIMEIGPNSTYLVRFAKHVLGPVLAIPISRMNDNKTATTHVYERRNLFGTSDLIDMCHGSSRAQNSPEEKKQLAMLTGPEVWAPGMVSRVEVHATNVGREQGIFFGEYCRGPSVQSAMWRSITNEVDVIKTPFQRFSCSADVTKDNGFYLLGYMICPRFGPLHDMNCPEMPGFTPHDVQEELRFKRREAIP